jgi:hypothetical protein
MLIIIIVNVIMLSVIMLNVIMQIVIMLNVNIHSAIMLIVVMLSVFYALSANKPLMLRCHYAEFHGTGANIVLTRCIGAFLLGCFLMFQEPSRA